jgi:hypothetical protein
MTKLVELLSKALSAATATPAAMLTANSKSERAAARQKAWIEKCKNATKCKHRDKIVVNVGNWKQMLPNNLPIGSLPS